MLPNPPFSFKRKANVWADSIFAVDRLATEPAYDYPKHPAGPTTSIADDFYAGGRPGQSVMTIKAQETEYIIVNYSVFCITAS